MNSTISINNENLANYIMFELDKIDNKFTEEELNQVTEVVIDFNEESDSSLVIIEELLKFKKLKTIILRNGFIYNDSYKVFKQLEDLSDVTFEGCEFENFNLISSLKLKSLSLINSGINDYSFIKSFDDLKELTIINGKLKIDDINNLKELTYLQLSYSEILDKNKLECDKIEELYIDNTNIIDFSFINNMTRLKKISIDENQYNKNMELFDNLRKNDIFVMNENMVTFGGDGNEL